MDKLTTGITTLDRRLDGGFKPGSLVAFVAPPAAQSHTILHQLMRQRPTVYVTTLRSADAIRNDLEHLPAEVSVTVEAVGEAVQEENELLHELSGSAIHAAKTAERDRSLDQVFEVVQQIEATCNFIVDPINPLERSESRQDYQRLLSKIAGRLLETGSLGVLHSTKLDETPPFRESTLTMADVVWELDIASGRRKELQIQTRVPKNRGGEAVLENLTLVIQGRDVYTDDSRNI